MLDQFFADRARNALVDAGCYPTADVCDDPGYDYYHRNIIENLLPDAIAKLDRNDLVAVYRLADFLVASPRSFSLPKSPFSDILFPADFNG